MERLPRVAVAAFQSLRPLQWVCAQWACSCQNPPPTRRAKARSSLFVSYSSMNPLTEQVGNIIPSRRARISEVFGRFAAFLCQHSFVNFQTAGVNPSTSAEAGFGGLSPLDTMRMTVGSGLSGKGISPLYSYKDMSADNQTDEMQDNKPPRQPLRVRRCQIP